MHLKTTITFSGFTGKSTVEQHRMVHSVLKEEIGREIHAITIHTSCDE
jgi:stress-induced morphogen